MWEIRETKDYPHYRKSMRGYREDPSQEAYECGYEDGYREAMKEAKRYYSEKGSSYRRPEEDR